MESKDITSFFITICGCREEEANVSVDTGPLFMKSITKSDFVIISISIPSRSGFQFRPRALSLLILSSHVKVSFTLTREERPAVDSDPSDPS